MQPESSRRLSTGKQEQNHHEAVAATMFEGEATAQANWREIGQKHDHSLQIKLRHNIAVGPISSEESRESNLSSPPGELRGI